MNTGEELFSVCLLFRENKGTLGQPFLYIKNKCARLSRETIEKRAGI